MIPTTDSQLQEESTPQLQQPGRCSNRIVVLISGFGSNLQALIDASSTDAQSSDAGSPATLADTCIALVVSNTSSAYGLQRAKAAGIPTLVFPFKPYRDAGKSRLDYDSDLASAIHNRIESPDLLVLAGFMHILSADFIARFPCGIINLHPALPGCFDGAHAIKRAYAAFAEGKVKGTGCMVHWVIPEVDKGEVLIQREVSIYETDTLESLEERIHAVEHGLIVEGVTAALQSKRVAYSGVTTRT